MQFNTFPGENRPGRATPTAGLKSWIPRIDKDSAHRKGKSYQASVDRAYDRFRPKGWVEEHAALKSLAGGLRWPLHVFSITLAALFALAIITQAITGDSLAEIWTHRADRLQDLYLPLSLVVAGLLCLEWAKSVVLDQAVTSLLKRKFGVGGFVLLVALTLSGASFYSSVMGGDVWGEVSTTPEGSELRDVEGVRNYWTQQIQSTQDNIDRIETRLKKQDSWNDRKPGGNLERLHKEKAEHARRMEAEMIAATQANDRTQAKAAIDGFFAGQILAYTSAGVEVLILLCLFYLVYHDYRVSSEAESGVIDYKPTPARSGIGFNAFAPTMEDPEAGKIGFRQGNSAPPAGLDLTGIAQRLRDLEARLDGYRPADPATAPPGRTVTVRSHTQGFPITCSHCGEEAVMKSPNAKYCSEECKKAAYNLRHPENQIRFNA